MIFYYGVAYRRDIKCELNIILSYYGSSFGIRSSIAISGSLILRWLKTFLAPLANLNEETSRGSYRCFNVTFENKLIFDDVCTFYRNSIVFLSFIYCHVIGIMFLQPSSRTYVYDIVINKIILFNRWQWNESKHNLKNNMMHLAVLVLAHY